MHALVEGVGRFVLAKRCLMLADQIGIRRRRRTMALRLRIVGLIEQLVFAAICSTLCLFSVDVVPCSLVTLEEQGLQV